MSSVVGLKQVNKRIAVVPFPSSSFSGCPSRTIVVQSGPMSKLGTTGMSMNTIDKAKSCLRRRNTTTTTAAAATTTRKRKVINEGDFEGCKQISSYHHNQLTSSGSLAVNRSHEMSHRNGNSYQTTRPSLQIIQFGHPSSILQQAPPQYSHNLLQRQSLPLELRMVSTSTTNSSKENVKDHDTIESPPHQKKIVIDDQKPHVNVVHGGINNIDSSQDQKQQQQQSQQSSAVTQRLSSSSSWVDVYIPPSIRPYAYLSRIDKPIGTWLLLWPCCWSTLMASTVAVASTATDPISSMTIVDTVTLLSQFTVGAFVMRGAGCTINDMWDQEYDRHVSRTKSRPLATGQITTTQAGMFLISQLAVGLGVLLSLPNTTYCFLWGASSLPLVAVYPLMKRFFPYPQLVLGLTFNWGAWMGWAATMGSIDYSVIVPLYLSGVAWTMVYDTIYANQDKGDDMKLGLHSTALTFSGGGIESNNDGNNNDPSSIMERDERQRRILFSFATLTYGSWLLSGYNLSSEYPEAAFSFVPYAVGTTVAYGHLLWQIRTAQLTPIDTTVSDDVNNCDATTGTDDAKDVTTNVLKIEDCDRDNLGDRFRSNATVGAIVFGSIIAGKVFPFVGL